MRARVKLAGELADFQIQYIHRWHSNTIWLPVDLVSVGVKYPDVGAHEQIIGDGIENDAVGRHIGERAGNVYGR